MKRPKKTVLTKMIILKDWGLWIPKFQALTAGRDCFRHFASVLDNFYR